MAVKRVKEIVGLKVHEASFVSAGANPGARKMFWMAQPPREKPGLLARLLGKKAPPKPHRTTDEVLKDAGYVAPPPRTTDEVLADQELWDTWYELRDAFDTAVCEIMWSDVTDKSALLLTSVTEYAARVEEAFGAMQKAFRPAEMFADAVEALCAEAIQKSEFNLEEFTQVIDAIQLDAKAPARSPAPAEGEEADMKIADLLKLWKGASKEEKAELAKIMKEDGEPLPAPVAAVDAAIAKAKADAAEELAKKQVTCPGCAHSFQMAAADKAAAYEASLPENVRKERQADKEKIAKLEADAHDAVMLRKAEAICPPGEDVQVVKGMLIRHAKDPKELEAVEKMFAGVKARAEAADRMLLQQSGNRGRPKPGSAAEEVLTKAEAVAKAKGIPMHKAIDEVESANPDLRDRAYAESRPGAAAQ